jgi:heme A synthase
LRLNSRFRYAVYAAIAVLFLSGVGWFAADWQKEDANGETWQQIAVYLLMLHGGGAMVTLLLLGALIPVHLLRSWRRGKNLVMGSVMVALNAVLIATAFGLYYLGSEAVRPWMSWVHLVIGALLPGLLALHIVLGRRQRA